VALMKEITPLAVAFTVLAGLVAWRETTRGTTRTLSDEAALTPLAVREFTEGDAMRIELTAPGASAPAYTLTRQDKSWRVVSDFTAPASGANITKLLDMLAKAEGEFRSDDKAALEQFDLSPAKAVGLRVLDKDGKDLAHVAVGRSSGARGAFVKNLAEGADESRAFSLTADLRGALGLSRTSAGDREPDKPQAGFFHEKEFPQFKLEKANRVEFVAPGRSVVFEKSKKGPKDADASWKLALGGLDAPVKQDGIERAIASLGGGIHPMALVDPAKKKELGFDTPGYRIAVTSEDGTTRAAVGTSDAECEHWYVRLDATQDPDVLFEASEYEFHQMFPAGAATFDLPKLDVQKSPPTRVVVEHTGRDSVEITRRGTKPADDWTLVSPAWPLTARQQALRGLGQAVTTVHFTDYIDPPATSDAPEATIRFGATGVPDDPSRSLAVFGKAPGGKDRLVTFGSPARWFVIAENTLDRLVPEPLSLVEPKVLHGWQRDEITAVRVGTDKVFAIVRDGEGWALDDTGTKTPADTKSVEAWLDRLLSVSVTGALPGLLADFEFQPMTIERGDGAPIEVGVSVTSDGKRVVVLGAQIFTVDDKDDLEPDRAALAVKTAEPTKQDGETPPK
jgi:hypothetical protein